MRQAPTENPLGFLSHARPRLACGRKPLLRSLNSTKGRTNAPSHYTLKQRCAHEL